MPDSLHQKYLKTLPLDWEQVPVEALGRVYGGGTPSRTEPFFWNGPIAWVTPTELTSLDSKWLTETKELITRAGLSGSAANLLPKGSLLVTTRATIGYVAIARIPVATNQGFKSIVPNELTNSDYYYHLLRQIAPEMKRLASGSTFDEISRRDFIAILVPRPDISEQIQIAEILDTVDAAIQRTETLIGKLRQIKDGLLHDLLTCGIDEHGQCRDPEAQPEQFKESLLGLIPREWEITTLGAIVARSGGVIQTGPFGSQLHAYEYIKEGVPVIMPQDIQNEAISEEQIARIPMEKAMVLGRHRLKLNDVVLARRGDLKRCASIRASEIGWLCGTGCLLVRASENEIDGRWLAATYRHHRSQRQILARAVGSTMVNLNTSLLANLLIAKPTRDEQVAIIAALNGYDAYLEAEQAYRDKLRSFKKGLLEDLLTGRVRVTGTVEGTST